MKWALLLVLIIFAYGVTFGYLSLKRHWSLNSTYLDLGLESQVVWNTSQGRFFETSFGPEGQIVSALSYHLTPIILFLVPIYKAFASPETLLVLQTLILSLGAIAVFFLARRVLDLRLALVFSLIYLLYPPLQYSNLFDFHYVTLATTFLFFAFYFMTKRRWFLFHVFVILSLLTKENAALVVALLGIYLFIFERERKRGLVIFLFPVIYFLLGVFYLMPWFGGGLGALGRYTTLIGDPPRAVLSLFNLDKLKYLFHLLVSVGFLPILAPSRLIPAASELFLNLFSDYNPQWQVKFHYTALVTPFIFVSAIYGAKRLQDLLKKRKISNPSYWLSLYLLLLSSLWSIIHSPAPLFYKFDRSLYTETKETREARQFLAKMLPDVSVSAMNNLAPHLSNRRFLYRFPIKFLDADYVVLDPSVVGNNYDLAQVAPKDYERYLNDLRLSEKYEKIVDQPRLLVFKKRP